MIDTNRHVHLFARYPHLSYAKTLRKLHLRKRSEWTSSHHRRWCSKGIGDVAPISGFAKIVNLYRFTLLATLCKPKMTAELFPNWEWFLSTTCGQIGHKLKSSFAIFNFCPNWAEVIFYSRRVVGDFTSRQFVGKLFCNFRPTWSEVIRRNTNWQAGQSGTTLLILQISLWNNLRKIACQGKHPCDPSNNICDIGCTSFQSFQKKNFVPNWDEVLLGYFFLRISL